MSDPLAESPSGSTIQQPPLHVLRWHDPLIDRLGHDPRSRYVERLWLEILGPSTTLVLRVLADALEVRHLLAPLNRSQIESLPLALQAEHQHLHEQPVAAGPARSRARRLALSLIECGDGFAETGSQLNRWRVPEPIAAEAVDWA